MADVEDKQNSAPKRTVKPKAASAGPATDAPESHAALARKYRPKVFPELIGQEAMVRTLRNAFASGRIAQAYMLTGVRGVGKTTTARLIARALNYEAPGAAGPTLDMAGEGVHCRAILESRHLDVVEMDAASHTGIDDIRELIDSAHYKPNTARYKVYIIDEVHMLSKQAFNGLLKTLEEPPEHVKFIFATTEARKVPVTVLSRCQRFDLKRIESGELAAHMASVVDQEGATAEPGALALIARAAEGSVRDALSILDRAIAFGSGKVETDAVRGLLGLADRVRIFDLLETVLKGDAGGALSQLAELNRDGAEPGQVITDLGDAVHAVTLVKAAGAASADPTASEAERARATDLAARLSMPALARAWQMLLKGHEEVRASPRPLAAADMVLVRLAYASDLPPPSELARRLRDGALPGEKGPGPSSAPAPKQTRKPAHAEMPPVQASGAASGRGRAARVGRPGPATGRCRCPRASQLRRRGGSCRSQARLEAQACSARAGAAGAFQARQYRGQPSASGAARPDPGPDEEAQGLDRPGVDRRGERRAWWRAARRPAPRSSRARDRSDPRASQGQGGAAAFPRCAHRRGQGHGRARARR